MPRAIWKGAISFGLVAVPVGLYTATERLAEIHFRLLHAKDARPVDYKRVGEAEGVEVPWSEIARGDEYAKGQHVIVTDKDFARRYAREIRPPDALDLPAAGRGADKRELALARQLIDTLSTH